MEWCEYRSPDGKPYYFNVKSSSSVWEKPQALKDYDGNINPHLLFTVLFFDCQNDLFN